MRALAIESRIAEYGNRGTGTCAGLSQKRCERDVSYGHAGDHRPAFSRALGKRAAGSEANPGI